MVTIDGIRFDVGIINITRKASLKENNLGTTQDLRKHYDVEGTYFDYEVTFNVRNMNFEDFKVFITNMERNKLYEKICEPVEAHIVTMPYANNSITFNAHLRASSDSLIFNYTRAKKWGGLKVSFEALEPQKVADI